MLLCLINRTRFHLLSKQLFEIFIVINNFSQIKIIRKKGSLSKLYKLEVGLYYYLELFNLGTPGVPPPERTFYPVV